MNDKNLDHTIKIIKLMIAKYDIPEVDDLMTAYDFLNRFSTLGDLAKEKLKDRPTLTRLGALTILINER